MLIGANKLTLNQATMVAAVQHYFDTVLFADGRSPKVTQVEKESKGYGPDEFAVSVEEKQQPAADGGAKEAT